MGWGVTARRAPPTGQRPHLVALSLGRARHRTNGNYEVSYTPEAIINETQRLRCPPGQVMPVLAKCGTDVLREERECRSCSLPHPTRWRNWAKADPALGQTPSVWGLGYHSLPCPLSFCQLPGMFCWGLEAVGRGVLHGAAEHWILRVPSSYRL